MNKGNEILRLILGDQLNINHSWFKEKNDAVTYVLMEVKTETDYVKHHIQKVMGFFAAMRNFAKELNNSNHQVIYIHLNDANNFQHFDKNCDDLIKKHRFTKFEYILPDEHRLDEQLKAFCKTLTIDFAFVDSEHFYTTRQELGELFNDKKLYLMETFYRNMRKKHNVLLDKEAGPLFGKWNFDEDNRKKLPSSKIPVEPFLFSNDLSDLENELKVAQIKTIGTVESKHFFWPVDRKESLLLLDFFLKHCLQWFGTYQDAMAPHLWSIYHSRLSFSLNTKMISPKEVIDKAIEYYAANAGEVEFNQLEGFVRQIIGWREYMRGIYWLKMPEYAKLNYFEHTAALPKWYWTGETNMNCMKYAIKQSLLHAYAHHIQRLMITGNFALLTGTHPDEVDEWYLGIYIDAIQWVEITNTRGMSQFADGGIVGSKPYVSSAAYINKMSSYCKGCHYEHDKKVGEKACPFNSLYWNFYHKHQALLAKNPRVSMMYNVWNKMNTEVKTAVLAQAAFYLKNINDL